MKNWRERKKNRAWWHDYSKPGTYFITICTKDRDHYFGKISNKKMELSKIGKIACQCWEKIPEISPDIESDNYVVMPNHLHGILIIKKRKGNKESVDRRIQRLPVVIGSYKSIVTKMARKNQTDSFFRWQKSYYDHIIRSDRSLRFIRQYILNNPANWQGDLENPEYLSTISEEERKARLEEHYDNLFKSD